MKRSRKIRRKRIKTEKEKGTRALEFICHKKQRCLSIKANEERLGQADPEKSLVFLTWRPNCAALSLPCLPPQRGSYSPKLISPSAQGVCSFSLFLCLQQHHSYKSNIRNLLHSLLDPAVSTISPCHKLSFAVEFIHLFCCCSSGRSSFLSLGWPETHSAAQV